ncbi:hypothetical protein LJR159_005636 [Pseudomonas brassicacearum]|nr:hypothetical protein [Pseudomonas sp. WCS365]
MGCRGSLAPDHLAHRRDPRLELQRLRQGDRRTGRAGTHHPLRIRRRFASGQPTPQPRRE